MFINQTHFLQVSQAITNNCGHLFTSLSKMPSTVHLQLKIGDVIEETGKKWSDEKYRITIESFQRKNSCLVVVHIGRWDEESHFFKCAVSVKPQCQKSFLQLTNIFSFLLNF